MNLQRNGIEMCKLLQDVIKREEKYGEKQKREKQQFVNSKQGSDKTRKKREEREVFYASVGVCLCVCVCVCACEREGREKKKVCV